MLLHHFIWKVCHCWRKCQPKLDISCITKQIRFPQHCSKLVEWGMSFELESNAYRFLLYMILFGEIWHSSLCYYTLRNEVRGRILDSPCLSVRLSVCLSVTFRVRPVASTVQDGFFPYLEQMINSMRGCVACGDLWPWPISSRSFGLDLENRVRSVAPTVLDGFFLYWAQMITIIRGCVACYVFFQNLKIWIFGKFLKFFGLDFEKKICSSRWIFSIFSTNDH